MEENIYSEIDKKYICRTDPKEWFKTHERDEPLLETEFTVDCDLSKFVDSINKAIHDNILYGGFEEYSNVSLPFKDIAFSVTKCNMISEKKYQVGIKVVPTPMGFIVKDFIENARHTIELKVKGYYNVNGELVKFIRFYLHYLK